MSLISKNGFEYADSSLGNIVLIYEANEKVEIFQSRFISLDELVCQSRKEIATMEILVSAEADEKITVIIQLFENQSQQYGVCSKQAEPVNGRVQLFSA